MFLFHWYVVLISYILYFTLGNWGQSLFPHGNTFQGGYRYIEFLIHCWQECNLVLSPEVEHSIYCDSANSSLEEPSIKEKVLHIYKGSIYKKIHNTISNIKNWKQLKSSVIVKWINKVHIHTIKYYP